MKKKVLCCLMAALLCLAFAGCGEKGGGPSPAAPVQDTAQPAQDAAPSTPEPEVIPAPVPAPQPVEPVLPDALPEEGGIADSYVGFWRDNPWGTSAGRCSMEIDCADGVNYDIYIFWSCSSATARYWHLTGTYDETQAGVVYTGIQFYGTTLLDGTVERSQETEDEAGILRLEDGVLHWDYKGVGENVEFNKES